MSLREKANEECRKILGETEFRALKHLPARLNAAAVILFVDKKDNDVVREALVRLEEEGSL